MDITREVKTIGKHEGDSCTHHYKHTWNSLRKLCQERRIFRMVLIPPKITKSLYRILGRVLKYQDLLSLNLQ